MKKIYLLAAALAAFTTTKISAQAGQWKLAGNALTGTEKLGSTNAFDVNFISNNLKRMTIKPDGRIGIGTTSPTAFLHVFGTTQIENNAATIYDEPLLTLLTNKTGTPTNPAIALRTTDTLYSTVSYDFSTRDFVITAQPALYAPNFIINHDNGFVGLGTKTPQKTLDVNGSAIVRGDFTVAGTSGLGDLFFTYYQQGIRFPTFGATNDNSAMIYMTDVPTSNARMVLSHSKAFQDWGLQYDDATDQFNFLGNGLNRMAINLSNGRIGLGVAAPLYKLDVSGTSRFLGNIGVQTAPNTRTIQCGSTQGALIGIGTAEYIQDAGNNLLWMQATLAPSSDNLYTLGNSTNRWASLWAVDGTINTSDMRDKTNIKDLKYGLKEVMQLHPVSFNWKKNIDNGTKLGVLAQEIQKVLPEVVRDYDIVTDETTGKQTKVPSERLGVMYSDIIPVLINAIQEQQKEIEELKDMIKNNQAASSSSAQQNVLSLALQQNKPNPVTGTTVISYNTSGKNVQLVFTDANGNTVKQMQLNNGNGSVTVDCSSMASGTYTYTLIADGKYIDSKKMIITK